MQYALITAKGADIPFPLFHRLALEGEVRVTAKGELETPAGVLPQGCFEIVEENGLPKDIVSLCAGAFGCNIYGRPRIVDGYYCATCGGAVDDYDHLPGCRAKAESIEWCQRTRPHILLYYIQRLLNEPGGVR